MPLVMTPLMNVRREILFATRSLVRLFPSGMPATSRWNMKQLDGTPFFADLMPESIPTQAKNSIGKISFGT